MVKERRATRYLGFKIGMDIDRSEHYNLLVDKIKAKLIWWNARKLSLATKIVIANKVLIASAAESTQAFHGAAPAFRKPAEKEAMENNREEGFGSRSDNTLFPLTRDTLSHHLPFFYS